MQAYKKKAPHCAGQSLNEVTKNLKKRDLVESMKCLGYRN